MPYAWDKTVETFQGMGSVVFRWTAADVDGDFSFLSTIRGAVVATKVRAFSKLDYIHRVPYLFHDATSPKFAH